MGKLKIVALGLMLAGFAAAPNALALTKWECVKDGKHLSVKGKPKAKKKACEAKGGTWQEATSPPAEAAAPAAPAAPAPDAGGSGGGW